MDKRLLQLVNKCNKSVWNEKIYPKLAKKGFYEVYFVILHNQQRNESYWIRYTVLCNKNESLKIEDIKAGEGLLWFGYFNAGNDEKTHLVKKSFTLSSVKGSYKVNNDYRFISINDSYISSQNIIGSFKTNSGKEYSWKLNLQEFQTPYDVVPSIAKKFKLSNTMNKATHPHARMSGELIVNNEIIPIEKADAIQYHTYADKYQIPWEWFSCYTIGDWPLGYIDLSYKVNKGILEIFDGKKRFTSWNKNFITKLLTSKKLVRNKTISSIMFNLEKKNFSISGIVTVDEQQLIGVEYKGPTGEKIYCYNSEIANCIIKIVINKLHSEPEIIEFSVIGSVAFETTNNSPIPGIRFLSWEEEEEEEEYKENR